MSDSWAPFMQEVDEKIKEHGWMAIGVFGTEDAPMAPCTYTVGWTERDLPELIIVGVESKGAHGVLKALYGDSMANPLTWRAITREQTDWEIETDTVDGETVKLPFRLRPVEPRNEVCNFGVALRRYGDEGVRAMQVLWPDEDGKYPDDEGYDMEHYGFQALI